MPRRIDFDGLLKEYCFSNSKTEHIHISMEWLVIQNKSQYEVTKITKKDIANCNIENCNIEKYPFHITKEIKKMVKKAIFSQEKEVII